MKKLLILVVALACVSSSAFAYYNTLKGFDHKRQSTDIWCWAAVTAMVGQQMTDGGQRISDYDILSYYFQTDCKRYPSKCYKTGQINEIMSMLSFYFDVDTKYVKGWASFGDIQDMIDADAPLVAIMRAKSGGGIGHVIVVSGYNDNNPNKRMIRIDDPMNYSSKWVRYETFIYNYGQMLWAETIFVIPETTYSNNDEYDDYDGGYFESIINE